MVIGDYLEFIHFFFVLPLEKMDLFGDRMLGYMFSGR